MRQLVIDLRSLEESLPRTVEAFFYLANSNSWFQEMARNTHRRFLEEYKLTAEEVPLLRLDQIADVPFKLASTSDVAPDYGDSKGVFWDDIWMARHPRRS